MADIDWGRIETEYLTTNTSYRKLSAKYHVNSTTIAKKARAENWVEKRKQHARNVLSETVSEIAKKQARKYARVCSIADKLLTKLDTAADQLDLQIISHRKEEETDQYKMVTEYIETQPGGVVDQKALKSLAAALKDLKEVQDLQCLLDQQEQEARIENLKSRAVQDQDTGAVLTIEGGDRYAN